MMMIMIIRMTKFAAMMVLAMWIVMVYQVLSDYFMLSSCMLRIDVVPKLVYHLRMRSKLKRSTEANISKL